jgi:glycosyltransferase involved in cell wall biosynthesis
MKILFINALDDPLKGGGTETTIWALVNEIIKRGHECTILSANHEKGLKKFVVGGISVWRAGIKNIYLPISTKTPPEILRAIWHIIDTYNPFMKSYVKSVIEIEKPNIVCVHNLPGWSCAIWEAIADIGIPFVQVLHDQYAICPKTTMYNNGHICERKCLTCSLLRIPYKRLSNKPTAVVGVSKFILERHLKFGYFSDVPIKATIHDARNPSSLCVGKTPEKHAPLRIGFIGRLEAPKGLHILIEAFSNYQNENAELWVAGEGKPEYVSILKDKFKDERIKFLGRVEPRNFYPEIDFTVVPSLLHDTFPGVVYEALAFGKPVIGSNRGGIPEMIIHGENGFIFEPESQSELLNYLQRLGNDKKLQSVMSGKARETVQPLLNVDAWADKYIDVYQQAIRHNINSQKNG